MEYWRWLAVCLLSSAIAACSQSGEQTQAQTLARLQERVMGLEAGQQQTQQRLVDMQRLLDDTAGRSNRWILWRSPRAVASFAPSMAFYPEDAFSEKTACVESAHNRVNTSGWMTTTQEPLTATDPTNPRASVVYLCLPGGIRPTSSI
ncbi:hypothetical protein [Dyella humicola]|uniref:hypothetical protein n=1 Tax=Dyella humicola TaxID=2992126 RepID=UPI002256F7ED|nr:hypothetical protein [Dyella humicola]